MPAPTEPYGPGGTIDNSPPVYWREAPAQYGPRAGGTAERSSPNEAGFSRPLRDVVPFSIRNPALKRRAMVRRPSGTLCTYHDAVISTPSKDRGRNLPGASTSKQQIPPFGRNDKTLNTSFGRSQKAEARSPATSSSPDLSPIDPPSYSPSGTRVANSAASAPSGLRRGSTTSLTGRLPSAAW